MPGNIINLTPQDIAAWPTPNYLDPEERWWMSPYAGCLYGLATIMVVLRLCLRWTKQAGSLGVDDVLLTLSWLFVTWFTAMAITCADVYHAGRHVWDIPLSSFPDLAKITWMAELSFLLTGCCVKVSVLLFYRRLTENICSTIWIWAVWAAIGLTVAYTLAFSLALVFNCTPTEAYWKSFDLMYAATVKYHCVNTTVINLLSGILAVVSDLYAVLLPCIMLRKLKAPLRSKIALNIVFSLGLLVVGASSVRTYWLWKCGHHPDVSYAIFNVFVWSQLELTLGIMCASAPSLRVIFREYLSDTLSRIARSVTSGGRGRKDSDIEQVIVHQEKSPKDDDRCGPLPRIFTKRSTTRTSLSDASAKFSAPRESVDVVQQKRDSDNKQYNYSWCCQTSQAVQARAMTTKGKGGEAWELEEKEVSPPRQVTVKTPEDYESYNLQSMERYRSVSRQPTPVPDAVRSRSAAGVDDDDDERKEFTQSMRNDFVM